MQANTKYLELLYRDYMQSNEQIPLNILINGYKVVQELGEGGFGKIYLGENDNKQKFALKLIDLNKIRQEKNPKVKEIKERLLINEPKCMMECDSSNVLKCYEILQNEDFKMLVLEYCNGKTLQEYLDIKGKLKEDQAVKILRQIINGIAELHKKKIIHRDLKSQNIMEHEAEYKIIDLGFSKKMEYINDREEVKGTILGTFTTMAPEVISKKQYGLKADIWSLGVIFFQMVFGIHLYDTLNARQRQKEIEQKKYFSENAPLNFKGTAISKEANNFLFRTLEVNTDKRMDWKELLQHPLIKIKQDQPIGDRFLIRPQIQQPMVSQDLEIERMRQQSKDYRIQEQIRKIQEKKQALPEQKRQKFKIEMKVNTESSQKQQKQQKKLAIIKQKSRIKSFISQEMHKKRQSLQFIWCKEGHLECVKTQFIFYQLIIPIEQNQLIDLSQRNNAEFMFLLAARCFSNMSPIKFKIQQEKDKENTGIKNLYQQTKNLYERVSVKFDEYGKKLTDIENNIFSVFGDFFKKRLLFWKNSYDERASFTSGIQIFDTNNPFKISSEEVKKEEQKQRKEGQKSQLYGDYKKIDQISFTYKHYIPSILKEIQKDTSTSSKKVISFLKYYDKLMSVSLKDLGSQSFTDYTKRTVIEQ